MVLILNETVNLHVKSPRMHDLSDYRILGL